MSKLRFCCVYRSSRTRGVTLLLAGAVAMTVVALLLPVREVALGSRIVDSQYLIILASMVLWGVSLGSTPVRTSAQRTNVVARCRDGPSCDRRKLNAQHVSMCCICPTRLCIIW